MPARPFVKLAATALAAVALAPAAPAAAAETACTLQPTGGTVTRQVDGRSYTVNVPAGLTAPAALVLAFHGAFSDSATMERFSRLTPFAAQKGFIVAYPQGLPEGYGYWRLGPGSADVAYARAVVRDIAAQWCVDSRRVHATGWSRGAVMSLRLACDAADAFASVAMYAGSDPTLVDGGGACTPSRPVSTAMFVGLLDPTYLTTTFARDRWIARNACPTPPRRESALLVSELHGPCAAGTEVTYRVYLQSHNWPVGADGADILERSWRLFAAHPLPG